MDAHITDFFNEINEIAPPVVQVKNTKECAWQECFDDNSGYPYYWNVNTNTVTWEIPAEYEEWLKTNKSEAIERANSKKPLFPSAINARDAGSSTLQSRTISMVNNKSVAESTIANHDVKKISALPSYLIDSDHDSSEGGHSLSRNGSVTNSPLHSNHSKASSDNETPDEVKPTLGFSLLADYGNDDSDSEEDDEEEPPTESHSHGHSTLFPITQPIDIGQFRKEIGNEPEPENEKVTREPEEIDVKAFKRKRRIGVHLVNHPKREFANDTNDKAGVTENNDNVETFKKKFGMSFVKGDTMPSSTGEVNKNGAHVDQHVDDTQTTLKEKLSFLSEGRDAVIPVQIMSIQLETLYNAWKTDNLNSAYFTTWIKDISNDLVKLEEEATPEGWNLEWDRNEKRYYYRNKANDECQWEYPQCKDEAKCATDSTTQSPSAELNAGVRSDDDGDEDDDDDAMDICTTPPPIDANEGSNIEVISISAAATDDTNLIGGGHKDENCNSTENAKEQKSKDFNTALDSFYSDIAAIETEQTHQDEQDKQDKQQQLDDKAKETAANDKLATPAAVNLSVSSANNTPTSSTPAAMCESSSSNTEPPKKKKKVKMSQGISMKKKGVSQMVEKWKNVQKDLD